MGAMAGGAGSSDPVALRPGGPADVAAVARLHARMIAEGFLSSLGERFLRRLYRRILRTGGSVLIVADDAGTVAGFVAGSRDVAGLFAEFARRDALVAAAGSPWRVLRSWRRVLETRRLGRDAGRAESGDGELLAIAVGEAWRGGGVGRRLVDALLAAMGEAGARTVDVVVGSDNDAAVALYRRAGFSPVRSLEVHRGTPSLLLRHEALPARARTAP